MQYECMMPCNMLVLYVPHQNGKLTKYRWHISLVTLIPIVSSSGRTYTNMVSVLTEEHKRYMTYITTYPQVAPTRLTLHEQCYIHYKNIFTSCVSDHKTFLDLYTP
jgi:hypothetical protein